jgi:hypothetical protein
MHVCMYVCMYVCVCMHVCLQMYVNVCMYVCKYMHVNVYLCMYLVQCIPRQPEKDSVSVRLLVPECPDWHVHVRKSDRCPFVQVA